MKKLPFLSTLFIIAVFALTSANAQCEKWIGLAQETEASDAHVVYRGLIKKKKTKDIVNMDDAEFTTLYDNWKLAYTLAPAADGKRASHYSDGRKLMNALFQRETEADKKAEAITTLLRLYDEQIVCYKNEAYLLGRKGYDMYRYARGKYTEENYNTLKESLEKGGNATEYIVFEPLAKIMIKFYGKELLTKEQMVELYKKMDAVMKYNMENNEKKKAKFEKTFNNIQNHFQDISGEIFDCAYFKELLLPRYNENPNDLETVKYVYVTLSKQECADDDPDMVELKAKYEEIAVEHNRIQDSLIRIKNPIYDGFQLEKEGKFKEAVARMKIGIDTTSDMELKAQGLYRTAHIQTWKFGQYQTARGNAQKAAAIKKDWGKPYILIGDIYAKANRSCGDDWNSRLAILAALAKYRYARSLDSNFKDEANKRIGRYSDARPEKQEGFMRSVKAGQKVKVGCWIGETVTVEFKD